MNRQSAIIIGARRTPVGRAGSLLKDLRAEELVSPLFQALLSEFQVDPAEIDDVILGNAVGAGGNLSRLAALTAGLPVSVPGMTVDRQCGSGLEAVNLACRLIMAGAGEVYLAGGTESCSTAPRRAERSQSLSATPEFFDRPRFSPESIGDPDMGVAAENVAEAYGITRKRQDAYALASHRKAIHAIDNGYFEGEILPIQVGHDRFEREDECPRRDTSLEKLSKLPPRFVTDGTVTAGNACPVNDGAAVVLVVSSNWFRKHALLAGLHFVDAVQVGVDPNLLGVGPVPATQMLLKRNPDIRLDDVDFIEFNEAFASQVLACLDRLGINPERVNKGGGALAIGHPYGASGAILVNRLFTQMVRQGGTHRDDPVFGIAMIGIGGGQGIASLFRRV